MRHQAEGAVRGDGGDYQPIPPEGLPLPHQAEGRHAGQGTAFGHPVQDPVHGQPLLQAGEEDGGAGPADSGRIPKAGSHPPF